ncbi:MAG: ArsR/SmtB family transcription factor [Pseudonocardiaceae bacterium]
MDNTLPHSAEHPEPDRPTPEQIAAATAAFAMLSDPTRLRMLWILREGIEYDVTTLAEAAGVPPTGASQHLSKLRLSGLVRTRRDGRRVLYQVRGGHLRRMLAEALFHTEHDLSGEPHHD